MARIASIANAGFEPVPEHTIAPMASLIEIDGDGSYAVFDPCAGEGTAIVGLTERIFPERLRGNGLVSLFACELEKTRAEKLNGRRHGERAGLAWCSFKPLHGDAFALQWKKSSVSLVYLNPPFDTDKSEARRMEEKFLRRFVPTIHIGGVLMFVLPFYALKHSAETIARNFRNVQCVRFPDWDFDSESKTAFKRVVLVGERSPELLIPDASIVADMVRWSESWQPIQDTWDRPLVKVRPCPDKYCIGFDNLKVTPLDVTTLMQKSRPWHSTDRGSKLRPVQGVVPYRPPHEDAGRSYPVVLPMKPAYLASGIAAGVFNGELIRPDDLNSGMPDILVKGVFRKDFVHVPDDDKFNKDGDKTQETCVEQPALVITVLDLREHVYHELKSLVDTTGETELPKMSVGDLLHYYGKSMMASLRKACPVLHDPLKEDLGPLLDWKKVPIGESEPVLVDKLPRIRRRLYQAQAHAVAGVLKIMGGVDVPITKRSGQTAYIIGDTGTGKTSMSIASAVAMGARRVLVMAPPIVVPVWQKEVNVVFPESVATAVVLETVHDVHDLANDDDPRTIFAIVSRETAKLTHAWEGIGTRVVLVRGEEVKAHARCPKCHAYIRESPETLASKRQTCSASTHAPLNDVAHIVRGLAQNLAQVFPKSTHVEQAIGSRMLRKMIAKWRLLDKDKLDTMTSSAWDRVRDSKHFRHAIEKLFTLVTSSRSREMVNELGEALLLLLVSVGEETPFATGACAMYAASKGDRHAYTACGSRRELALKLLTCCEKKNRGELASELRDSVDHERSSSPWSNFDDAMVDRDSGKVVDDSTYKHFTEDRYRDHDFGDSSAALAALEKLSTLATWQQSEPCGEHLYQAIPEPRRVALAPYVAKKFPKLFQTVIFDEFHELSNSGDSAQSKAMQRLAQLGLPTIALTGSFMNGYAKSMFAGMWALDPDFRREFDRNQEQEFVRRYGYLKIKVEMKDKETGDRVTFGAMSDRVERAEREAGSAPGVLPLFVLQYLLKRAIVVHKDDLNIDLPPCKHFAERITADDDLLSRYRSLSETLRNRIKGDAFGPMAGKLFGAVSELPSYLDRATSDTGNGADGWWRIRYPVDELGDVGGLVAEQEPFDAQTLLFKEKWILETTRKELLEGRNVLIYAYHASVLPRLRRLVQEQLGEACALILASESDKTEKTPKKLPKGIGPVVKLPPKKREPWIDENVSGKIRVLVINSSAVQVGLNSLTWFNSIIWCENPAVNPIALRQANGRIYRPGQTKETRIFFPFYENTAQSAAHSLLMQKVAVSEGTDGLDARGALAAAGIGNQAAISALSVGKQLLRIMEDEERAPVMVRPVAQVKKIAPADFSLPSLRHAENSAQIEQMKLF